MTRKRFLGALGIAALAVLAALLAWKLYLRVTGGDETQPGIIFERTDRPSRA